MALTILNNISSLSAENALSMTQANLQKTLTQLSTGLKINSGSDDAAGLSFATGMQANVAALTQSQQNASNGIGLLQTADGALSQVTTLLNRAVTLATEGATSGVTSAQSSALNNEFGSILNEVNQIGQTTNFNGTNVFGSNAPTTFTSTQGTALVPLSGSTALTAGSVTTVSDSATGGTMVFTAKSGNTLQTLETAVSNAVSAGTLSAGTVASVNASTGKFEIGPNTGTSGLSVSTNDAALGTMNATAPPTATTSTQGTAASPLTMGYTSAAATGGDALTAGAVTTIKDATTGGTFTYTAKAGDTTANLVKAIDDAGNQGVLSVGTKATQGLAGAFTIAGGSGAALSITETGETTSVTMKGGFTGTGTATLTASVVGVAAVTVTNTGTGTGTAMASGDTVKIQDSATGGTFTFTAGASTNNTLGDLQQQILGAVQNGKLSAGTSAKINTNGQLEIDSTNGTAESVIANSTALGAMNTVAPTATNTSTVFISDGSTAATASNVDISTNINSLSATSLNLASNNLNTAAAASDALTAVTAAISTVTAQRGVIGASVNRLTAASSNMSNAVTNLTSAVNSVENADIGKTVANMTQYNVLQSTGMSALQQSNQAQQAVLKLVQ